ncbi:hypothetical protein LTR50_006393 [Elasticomyces elasticus]|nr:hypothetical protein LTR50_006393 [Elasticomyces elasticus]
MHTHDRKYAALLAAAFLTAVYILYSKLTLYFSRRKFRRARNCQPPASRYGRYWPLSEVHFLVNIIRHARAHTLLPFTDQLYSTLGPTFITGLQRTGIFTNEPDNIKAALATRFDDYAVAPIRQQAVKHLLGEGIFTTDGRFWAHSRAMLRPNFAREQVAELTQLEAHMRAFLALVPNDGATVDLQDLFHRYSLDASTQFLFGASKNSLAPDQSGEQETFAASFDYAMLDAMARNRFGRLYYMWPDKRAAAAVKYCRNTVQEYVDRALAYRRAQDKTPECLEKAEKDGRKEEKGHYVFLHELAKQISDPVRIRDETLSVLFAGRDTTAGLLSGLWYELARNADVWRKLLAEVDELDGELPTYEVLRNMKFLKYCVSEALRLHPPVPILSKVAIRDTVLPLGGGPDGKAPLFVKKDSILVYSIYSMHRRKDVWGDDAADFRPERWADAGLRPGWAFLPFGGGPRVCLGPLYYLLGAEESRKWTVYDGSFPYLKISSSS